MKPRSVPFVGRARPQARELEDPKQIAVFDFPTEKPGEGNGWEHGRRSTTVLTSQTLLRKVLRCFFYVALGHYFLVMHYLDLDRIVFDDTVTLEDVSLQRTGDGNLIVRYGIGDEIHINGQYATPGADIEAIVFADGRQITQAELNALPVNEVNGTANADELHGTPGADTLRGHAGNDTLDGGAADRLISNNHQTGADLLDGGTGADTYALYYGMGADHIIDTPDGQTNTLKLLEGATFDSVKITKQNNDLVVALRGGADSARVRDFFSNGGASNWQIASAGQGSQSLLDLYAAHSAATDSAATDALQNYQQQLLGEWRAGSVASFTLPNRVSIQSSWSQTTSHIRIRANGPVDDIVNAPVTLTTVGQFGVAQGLSVSGLTGYGQTSLTQRQVTPLVTSLTSNGSVIATQQAASTNTTTTRYTFDAGGGGPYANARSYSYSTSVFAISDIVETTFAGWVPLTLRQDNVGKFRLNVVKTTAVPVIEKLTGGAGGNAIYGALNSLGDHVALIDAGAGDDTVFAGQYDFAYGNSGDDVIDGGAYAYGGAGDDVITNARYIAGGAGDDLLFGGDGNDQLSGGDGKDTYIFNQSDGIETLIDTASDTLRTWNSSMGDDAPMRNLINKNKYLTENPAGRRL